MYSSSTSTTSSSTAVDLSDAVFSYVCNFREIISPYSGQSSTELRINTFEFVSVFPPSFSKFGIFSKLSQVLVYIL